MLEELKEIDVSAIQELRSITKEQDTLRKRLESMEKKKESVSDAVYERVQSDYGSRYDELEATASPLKDQARSEYAKLKALIDRMEAVLEEANLAKEELSFRHDLGEFNEKDFKAQLEEREQKIEQSQSELDQANQLKAKFIAAFHSEEELEDSMPPPPPAPASAPPEAPAEVPDEAPATEPPAAVPDEAPAEEPPPAPPEEPPPAPPEEPAETPADAAAAPAEAPADDMEQDATALLQLPRLVSQTPEGAEEEYPLAVAATTIGRLDSNDICIPHGTVSRFHARVEVTDTGFKIVDLESENGVFVNGERVTEHELKEGDRIEIGPGTKEFVYTAG
jgi:pSer/pThr/pTyr-binding forkhead associated (FHA) protein